MRLRHWERIVDDLLEHPGSSWLEVTDRVGIPSPHRRAPDIRKHGYKLMTRFERGRYVHYCYQPNSEGGADSHGSSTPVDSGITSPEIGLPSPADRRAAEQPHGPSLPGGLVQDGDDAIGRREEEAVALTALDNLGLRGGVAARMISGESEASE